MIDLISALVVPSGAIILLTVLSLFGFIVLRHRKTATLSAIAAVMVYGVFGSGFVAHGLLGPLERVHPPVTRAEQLGEIKTIVVLTGHAQRMESLSPASWINESAAYRIIEAQWLKQQFPEAEIVISGTAGSAIAMRDVLLSLGLPEAEVLLDAPAIDTARSAANLQDLLANDNTCALVTSAGHMPRAMLSMQKRGIHCQAVPTEFYTPFQLSLFGYLPSAGKLKLSDYAFHEYIGIAWHWMLGNL